MTITELNKLLKAAKPHMSEAEGKYYLALHKFLAQYVEKPTKGAGEIYQYFSDRYLEVTHSSLPNYGVIRDKKVLRTLLRTHTKEEIIGGIEVLFKDRWCQVNGYLLTFLPNILRRLKSPKGTVNGEFHEQPNY